MSKATIIRGAAIIQGGEEVRADLLIEDTVIAAIGSKLDASGTSEVDATGCLLLPGIIDAHVQFGIHYRDTVASDNFESGSLAAAAISPFQPREHPPWMPWWRV